MATAIAISGAGISLELVIGMWQLVSVVISTARTFRVCNYFSLLCTHSSSQRSNAKTIDRTQRCLKRK